MVVVALLSVDLVESVDLVSVVLVVNCIDPINSHTSYFGKSTGSNKRSVPINRTVSSNRSRRVIELPEIFAILLIFGLLPPHVRDVFRGLSEDLRAARFVTL